MQNNRMQSKTVNIQDLLDDFNEEELEEAKKLLQGNTDFKIAKLEKSLYRVKPPTPKEFLEDWIGQEIKKGLYSHVIEMFCEMWDPDNNYHETVLYGATRTGKSVLSRLGIVYCIVRLWCLKSPHDYYGLSKISSLAVYLMCFSKQKARQLLLKPIENILKASPKFHQVLFEDRVETTQEKLGSEKIVWSTADKIGEMGFSNDIHICLGASPLDIIGADIIMAVISEINFFLESVGVSEEDVWRVYTDTKDRIEGTVAKKYGSMIVLDSSANSRDSLIESYILNDAKKDPNVYYKTFTRWGAVPDRFPEWQKTGETFKVFKGDRARAPGIVDENFKLQPGDARNVIEVPIDSYDTFYKNIYKALKDIAGIPTGAENIFFPNMEYVKDSIFDYDIPNVTTPIEAPLKERAEELIMDKVRDVFMHRDISGKWVLKRARSAPRWLRIDLSESSDRTGIAMCHPEMSDSGIIYCVFDFAFDVRPVKDGINLDAVKEFARILYRKYHIFIAGISTDKYQSSFIGQAIKKDEKEYKLISVDGDKTPYLVFKSKVLNGAIKVGYYLNIYNNLRSLIENNTKIDHIQTRKDSQENKNIGFEAKDISDAMAGASHHMYTDVSKFSIKYNYDDITQSIAVMKEMQGKDECNAVERAYLFENLIKNVLQSDKMKVPKPFAEAK